MTIKRTTDINVTVLDVDPATGITGQVHYNSTENRLKVYTGTQWVATSGTAVLPAGGNGGQVLTKINSTDYNTQWADVSSLNATAVQMHVYVKNGTGIPLLKGQVVYINGSNGTNPTVALAKADSGTTSDETVGFLEQNLTSNGFGYVATEGLLNGLDTSAANAGDSVWLSPTVAGGVVYEGNKPYAPYHMVYLGVVTKKSAGNGEIYVKVRNGFTLNELHDVAISSLTNKDLISYDSTTSLWKNVNSIAQGQITNLTSDLSTINSNIASKVASVSGTSPIAVTTGTAPTVSIQDSSTTQKGAVQLTNDITSISTTTAATANIVTYAYNQLNTSKAPLASPTFTGTPAAPTATAGTNTTQIATTAYVRGEVSALVASAPTTLDTLNELATALGNDANFSTTVTTALGLKAPLASPVFTGTPTANTAAVDTNTTQLATTAFVIGQASATTPAATGTAATGTSLKYARADHVHAQTNNGTVTSVGMTVPSILSVSPSSIASSGTFAVSLATQTANTLFAGPSSGSAAAPSFRAMVASDVPDPVLGGALGVTKVFRKNNPGSTTTSGDELYYNSVNKTFTWTITHNLNRLASNVTLFSAASMSLFTGAGISWKCTLNTVIITYINNGVTTQTANSLTALIIG